MVASLFERVLGTVENFGNTLLNSISNKAEELVNQGVHRLFGLLILATGMIFFLIGAAQVMNQLFQFQGVGEMIIGTLILLVTAIVLLIFRKR